MDYFFPFRPTFIAVWANVCEAPLEEGQTPFDRTFYRMKKFLFAVLALVHYSSAYSQSTSNGSDSIYTYAEFMPIPMIRSCESQIDTTWTFDSLRTCGIAGLSSLIANELIYPIAAQRDSIQGRVIISFVIDTSGRMREFAIAKEIGGGCGDEAKRIFVEMDNAGLRWLPAVQDDKKVSIRMNWPIKFQLKTFEAPAYYFNSDSVKIYSNPDSFATYKAGEDALYTFLIDQLEYPKNHLDSCRSGILELSLLIDEDGEVEIENMVDFNNLGYDFQWQAIRLVNKTANQWNPAMYKGEAVTSTYPVRVLFKSNAARCKAINDAFDQAAKLNAEGLARYDEGKYDEAIALYDQALNLHPNNSEYLYYRGSAWAAKDDREKACADYQLIKAQLGVVWFESIRRLMCGG